ncbi:MAG: cell division protein FtsZ [bacterium]|nr:cell division protein FtsZ [bacterium]
MMFEFAEETQRLTDIRVAGVGGAGGNAVNRMIGSGLNGVEFLALNTDSQALADNKAHNIMQIGTELTQGLGSGGKPSVGEGAAEEDRDAIRQAVGQANLVFVTAGMGGGTGTGAAPVVAEIARKQGALTVGIVTKPFLFEGRVRMQQAEAGIARMRDVVDTLIVVPNQRLLEIVPPNTSMDEAFLIADQVLYEATRGIFDIISRHDTLNLDFADVRSVMQGMGVALMGTGRATGENRALEAAEAAINSPLLENLNIRGSKAVLVNVLGAEVGLHDTAAAMQFIQEAAGPEAHVIFGYGIDPDLGDTLQVTVIATGFEMSEESGGTVSMAMGSAVIESAVESVSEPSHESTCEQTPEPVSEPEAEIPQVAETPQETMYPSTDADSSAPVNEVLIDDPVGEEWELAEASEPEPQSGDKASISFETFENEPLPVSEQKDVFSVEPGSVAPAVSKEPTVVSLFVDPPHSGEPDVEQETLETPEVAEAEAILEEMVEEATPPPFLQRAAAAGGSSDMPTDNSPSDNSRFLRPAGTKNIGEVEVPETENGPVPISRSTASGLGPDKPGEDRATPAYIRKYMD